MDQKIYNKYSDFLKEYFGEKVYKLPISLPLTCPNRNGTCGYGGCIYCSEEGGSHENLENTLSITEQININKEYIGSRYGAKKFIAYFQSFTNTYLPYEEFVKNIEESIKVSEIVGINISTRPDSITDDILNYLEKLSDDYLITVEYGLQSVNNRTLKIINRGHKLSDFIDAVIRTKKRGLRVCVHLIGNLPWDDIEDLEEGANILSVLKVDEVKLHSLYIVEDTILGEMFKKGEINMGTMDEYVERVITFLTHLSPNILVQRLLGRAPEEKTLFSNWDTSWWKIQDLIIKKMETENLYQGKYCKFKNL